MNDDLDQKTDAELNEAFAVEVEGLRLRKEWHGMQCDPGDIALPRYCADANAVLPWLEKCARAEAVFRYWTKPTDWVVDCTHDASERMEEDWCSENAAIAPTFARAAVIALLRAARAQKGTT